MTSRIRLPREDRRRWGAPLIWAILIAIVVALCIGCSDILRWFGLAA